MNRLRYLGLGPLTLLAACLATPEGAGSFADGGVADGGPLPTQATACTVAQAIFIPKCSGCHDPGGQPPELTLEGTKTGLVGVASAQYAGRIYVVAGDPASSFLYLKLEGTQAAHEGQRMPPGSALSAPLLGHVKNWIERGAPVDCTPIGPDPEPERHHPEGFDDPDLHGVELELGLADCRDCHGADLTGGVGPSCDSCHEEGWRTDCTFCHGGVDNPTGAPPRDLGNLTELAALSFRAHSSHVGENNHAPFDCTQCHEKPDDVLSAAHVFDSTRGRAEVGFGQPGALSPTGNYLGEGSCASLYCHGNGRGTGSYDHEQPKPSCTTCHGGIADDATWRALSGLHADHLKEDISCADCHADTANVAGTGIVSPPTAHVNGAVDLRFAPGTITRTNELCSGICHQEDHQARSWIPD